MFEDKKEKILYKYLCEICDTSWYMNKDFREHKTPVVSCPLECEGNVVYKGKRVLKKHKDNG